MANEIDDKAAMQGVQPAAAAEVMPTEPTAPEPQQPVDPSSDMVQGDVTDTPEGQAPTPSFMVDPNLDEGQRFDLHAQLLRGQQDQRVGMYKDVGDRVVNVVPFEPNRKMSHYVRIHNEKLLGLQSGEGYDPGWFMRLVGRESYKPFQELAGVPVKDKPASASRLPNFQNGNLFGGQGKPLEWYMPVYEGQSEDEALLDYVERSNKVSGTQALSATMMGTLSAATFGLDNLSTDVQRAKSQLAAEMPPHLLDRYMTTGNTIGIVPQMKVIGWASHKLIKPIVDRVMGGKVVTETFKEGGKGWSGTTTVETVSEGLPGKLAQKSVEQVLRNAEQVTYGTQGTQGVLNKMAEAMTTSRFSPVRWATELVGRRSMNAMPRAVSTRFEQSVRAATERGVRFHQKGSSLTLEIPKGTPATVFEELKAAASAFKGAMGPEASHLSIRIMEVAVPLTAGAGVGAGLGAMHTGVEALTPGLTPEQRMEVLRSAPGNIAKSTAEGVAIMGLPGILGRKALARTGPEPIRVWGPGTPKSPAGLLGPPIASPGASGRNIMVVPPTVPGQQGEALQVTRGIQTSLRAIGDSKRSQEVGNTIAALNSTQIQMANVVSQLMMQQAEAQQAGVLDPTLAAQAGQAQKLLTDMSNATMARLSAIQNLGHLDLTSASSVMGIDALSILLAHNIDPAQPTAEADVFELMEWAHTVGEEASTRGMLKEATKDLPPVGNPLDALTIKTRIRDVAELVAGKHPDALVGMPPALKQTETILPPALADASPGQLPAHPRLPFVRERLQLSDAPTLEEKKTDLETSLAREQVMLDKIVSGTPTVVVGSINPTRLSELADYDPIPYDMRDSATGKAIKRDAIKVFLEDGRFIAQMPNPNGPGLIGVDLSNGVGALNLADNLEPTTHISDESPFYWEVQEDHVVVRPDMDTPRMVGVREQLRRQMHEAQGTIPEGTLDAPSRLYKESITQEYGIPSQYKNIIKDVDRLAEEHKGKAPEVTDAARWYPRDVAFDAEGRPSALTLSRYGEMIRDHFYQKFMLEGTRATALRNIQRLKVNRPMVPGVLAENPSGYDASNPQPHAPTFYMKSAKLIEANSQKKWKKDQLLGWLKKNQQGVKKDEFAYLDLEKAFGNKNTITKDDLLAYILSRGVAARTQTLGRGEVATHWTQLGENRWLGSAIGGRAVSEGLIERRDGQYYVYLEDNPVVTGALLARGKPSNNHPDPYVSLDDAKEAVKLGLYPGTRSTRFDDHLAGMKGGDNYSETIYQLRGDPDSFEIQMAQGEIQAKRHPIIQEVALKFKLKGSVDHYRNAGGYNQATRMLDSVISYYINMVNHIDASDADYYIEQFNNQVTAWMGEDFLTMQGGRKVEQLKKYLAQYDAVRQEENIIMNESAARLFTESHWDSVPNVIGHSRQDEFWVYIGGKNSKVSVTQEIQSDYMKQKRTGLKYRMKNIAEYLGMDERDARLDAEIQKNGPSWIKEVVNSGPYKLLPITKLPEGVTLERSPDPEASHPYTIKDDSGLILGQGTDPAILERSALARINAARSHGVPKVPGSNLWKELILKDRLRRAAEDGSDYFAVTSAEVQQARWDLGQMVSEVNWHLGEKDEVTGQQLYNVIVTNTQGRIAYDKQNISLEQLNSEIGGDLTEKVRSEVETSSKEAVWEEAPQKNLITGGRTWYFMKRAQQEQRIGEAQRTVASEAGAASAELDLMGRLYDANMEPQRIGPMEHIQQGTRGLETRPFEEDDPLMGVRERHPQRPSTAVIEEYRNYDAFVALGVATFETAPVIYQDSGVSERIQQGDLTDAPLYAAHITTQTADPSLRYPQELIGVDNIHLFTSLESAKKFVAEHAGIVSHRGTFKADDVPWALGWAESLYDQQIPRFLNKHAKKMKWGVKVEKLMIPVETHEGRIDEIRESVEENAAEIFSVEEVNDIEYVEEEVEVENPDYDPDDPNSEPYMMEMEEVEKEITTYRISEHGDTEYSEVYESYEDAEYDMEEKVREYVEREVEERMEDEDSPEADTESQRPVWALKITDQMRKDLLFKGQPFYTNKVGYNTRPGENPDPTEVNELIEDHNLADATKIKSGVEILAEGLPEKTTFDENGHINMRGKRVTSAQELVDATRIYRNPRFEVGHHIYIGEDSGIVHGHMSLTAKMPGTTPILDYTKSGMKGEEYSPAMQEATETRATQDFAHRIARLTAKHGERIRVVVMHNHPSGRTDLSGPDIEATVTLARMIQKAGGTLWGQLVIDHDEVTFAEVKKTGVKTPMSQILKGLAPPPQRPQFVQLGAMEEVKPQDYAVLEPQKIVPSDYVANSTRGWPDADPLKVAGKDHPVLGQKLPNISQAANMGYQLNKNPDKFVSVLYTDGFNAVVGAELVPLTYWTSPKKIGDWLRGRARMMGGQNVLAYHPDPSETVADTAGALMLQGELVDFSWLDDPQDGRTANSLLQGVHMAGEIEALDMQAAQAKGARAVSGTTRLMEEKDPFGPQREPHPWDPNPGEIDRVERGVLGAREDLKRSFQTKQVTEVEKYQEALQHVMSGGSFSERPDLFARLAPEEKHLAMAARIGDGYVTSHKHLARLNPESWKGLYHHNQEGVVPGLPVIKAHYSGHQSGGGYGKGFDLWTLDSDYAVGTHVHNAGSTIAPKTINEMGFSVPAKDPVLQNPPRYFRGWVPSEDQMASLQKIYDARKEHYQQEFDTIHKMEQVVTKRLQAADKWVREGKETLPEFIDLKDLTSIQVGTLDKMSLQRPDLFAEFVRQFWKEWPRLTTEAGVSEIDQAEQMVSVIESTLEDFFEESTGSEFQDLPPDVKKAGGALRSQSSRKGIEARMQQWWRPFTALGPRSQYFHVKEWKDALEQGLLDRDVFITVDKGNRAAIDAGAKDIEEFETLERAIERNRKINSKTGKYEGVGQEITHKMFMAVDYNWPMEKLSEYNWDVKVAPGKTEQIRLDHWVPKFREWAKKKITEATGSVVAKTWDRAAGIKISMREIQDEMDARLVQEAKDWLGITVKNVNDIPEAYKQVPVSDRKSGIAGDATMSLLKGRLRQRDRGVPGLTQANYSNMPFNRLEALHDSRAKKRDDLVKDVEYLERGKLARNDYIYYLHQLTAEDAGDSFYSDGDPFFSWLGRRRPDIKNFFLQQRSGMTRPIEDWSFGWRTYLRTMNKTIHVEPALRQATHMVNKEGYPEAQRQYFFEMAGRMKGIQPGPEKMMDKILSRDLLWDGSFRKKILNMQGVNTNDILEEYGDIILGKAPGKSFRRTLVPAFYGFFLNGLKVSALNMIETGYVIPELAHHLPDLMSPRRGLWWTLSGHARTTGTLAAEGVSRAMHSVFNTPEFYKSRARQNHVLDYLHEAVSPGKALVERSGSGGAMETWNAKAVNMYLMMSGVTPTEQYLRAYIFDVLRRRALFHGLSSKEADYEASLMTNHVVGSFNKMGQSPKVETDLGRFAMMLQRYSLGKLGEAGAHMRPLAEATGLKAKPGGPPPRDPYPDKGLLMGDFPGEDAALGRVTQEPAPHGMRQAAGAKGVRRSLSWWAGLMLMFGVTMPVAKKMLEALGYRYKNFWNYFDPYYIQEFGSVAASLGLDGLKVFHALLANMLEETGAVQDDPRLDKQAKQSAARLMYFGIGALPGLSPVAGIAYRGSMSKREQEGFGGNSEEGFGGGGGEGFGGP